MRQVLFELAPPAWVMIELRDLDEAELFVVVGTDPFGAIDGALSSDG